MSVGYKYGDSAKRKNQSGLLLYWRIQTTTECKVLTDTRSSLTTAEPNPKVCSSWYISPKTPDTEQHDMETDKRSPPIEPKSWQWGCRPRKCQQEPTPCSDASTYGQTTSLPWDSTHLLDTLRSAPHRALRRAQHPDALPPSPKPSLRMIRARESAMFLSLALARTRVSPRQSNPARSSGFPDQRTTKRFVDFCWTKLSFVEEEALSALHEYQCCAVIWIYRDPSLSSSFVMGKIMWLEFHMSNITQAV